MLDVLKGGICILGRRFHLVRSSKDGAFYFERAPCCGFETQERHSYLRAPFAIFRVLGWEAQRASFFRFRGSLVVFDELRGGT